MSRGDLTNAEWERLRPLLPEGGGRGRRWNDHRTTIDGVLYRARTGVPWRICPSGSARGSRSTNGTAAGRPMAPGRCC
ncbi:transposase [Nonomuraea diastatica]|uniref:Transposase n=1 Tax=Nonomuraea diastatica TaxID=1848329 RepID=A0A4R4WLD5_9ACTN|nr:transposase [Nonomuraea diastatica]